jgi:hypothetical protein
MNARGQRALARRNMRESVEEVPAGPIEENSVESEDYSAKSISASGFGILH